MKLKYKILFLFFVISLALFLKLPDGLLHLYFLDVGQGDSAVIKTPTGQIIIIDGGPNSNMLDSLAKLMPPFDHEIDLIVLSHPHEDHLYGFIDLLKRYEVKAVLMSGINYNSSTYDYFIELINQNNVPVYLARIVADFDFGGAVFLDVLRPKTPSLGTYISNLNNDSVVVKLNYGKNKVLFTGDSEKEAERDMLKMPFDYSAQLLKIGHHGSKTSTTDDFLKSVDPRYALISAGRDNQFKHPHRETLDKLKDLELYRTDLKGGMEFVFDKEGLILQRPISQF